MSDITPSIDTKKFVKSGKVNVDGMVWDVSLPGAGKELQMSKARRRIELLERKIQDKTATEEDLDKYDYYEDFMYEYFAGIFKDSTEDNSEVRKWLDETPLAFILQALEDIRKQADNAEAPAA